MIILQILLSFCGKCCFQEWPSFLKALNGLIVVHFESNAVANATISASCLQRTNIIHPKRQPHITGTVEST